MVQLQGRRSILLYEKINRGKPFIKGHCSSSFKFSYIWFLTSLFHDFGYIVEESIERYPIYKSNNPELTFRTICKKLNINYTPYSKERTRVNDIVIQWLKENIINLKLFNSNFLPCHKYTRKTVVRYYDYCLKMQNPFHNHGVIGGFLIFNNAMKNYLKAYQFESNIKYDINYRNFEHNYRSYRSEQFEIFRYIADTIISHNIWLPKTDEDKERYKDQGLDELICTDKISFSKDPLLFILAITDTIEPTKIWDYIDAKAAWDNISIDYDKMSGIRIELLNPTIDFNPFEEKIISLENWLEIEVFEDFACHNKAYYINIL